MAPASFAGAVPTRCGTTIIAAATGKLDPASPNCHQRTAFLSETRQAAKSAVVDGHPHDHPAKQSTMCEPTLSNSPSLSGFARMSLLPLVRLAVVIAIGCVALASAPSQLRAQSTTDPEPRLVIAADEANSEDSAVGNPVTTATEPTEGIAAAESDSSPTNVDRSSTDRMPQAAITSVEASVQPTVTGEVSDTNERETVATDSTVSNIATQQTAATTTKPEMETAQSAERTDAAASTSSGSAVAPAASDLSDTEVISEESTSLSVIPSQKATAERASSRAAWLNIPTNILLGVVLGSLAIASLVGRYLRTQPTDAINPAMVRRFRQRLNAWWLMCAILVFGFTLQQTGTVILFGLVSFWALREFITMAPTRRGDHRALFWALIFFTPLQYVLIALDSMGMTWRSGRPVDFYGIYSIMIPVYAGLFVPARIAIAGDHKRFLERSAQITAGLLICVYALSHAPALITLDLASSSGEPWKGSPAGLLFFFILISQLSDILQWLWSQIVGKRLIAEDISSSRTWEGFAGGTLSTGLIGALLFWVTPFTIWEAACLSMLIGSMGMLGGMTMSAIKRDRGVNDYGSLVLGHAGVLDRIDTVCFAAPVFFHITRFFFTV